MEHDKRPLILPGMQNSLFTCRGLGIVILPVESIICKERQGKPEILIHIEVLKFLYMLMI